MSECIESGGGKNAGGYGKVKRNGRNYLAHRLAWIDAHGEIPDGLHVLHKCDHPGCINLDHLFLGNNAANMKDKTNKKRQTKGSQHPLAKITEADIPEIRRRLGNGELQGIIAHDYGVARSCINRINTGKLWKHA